MRYTTAMKIHQVTRWPGKDHQATRQPRRVHQVTQQPVKTIRLHDSQGGFNQLHGSKEDSSSSTAAQLHSSSGGSIRLHDNQERSSGYTAARRIHQLYNIKEDKQEDSYRASTRLSVSKFPYRVYTKVVYFDNSESDRELGAQLQNLTQ